MSLICQPENDFVFTGSRDLQWAFVEGVQVASENVEVYGVLQADIQCYFQISL